MRDIVLVLMEGNTFDLLIISFCLLSIIGVPSHINLSQVIKDLRQIEGVRNAHSLHIWALTMQRTAHSVHIAIGPCHCASRISV